PALRKGGLSGSEGWTIRVFKPGARPLVELAAQVVSLRPDLTMAGLLAGLQKDARTLDLEGYAGQAGRSDGTRLVWVVGQFEEVFTLSCEQERAMFLQNLLDAAAVPGGSATVVLTMRADFYPQCAAEPGLSQRITSNQYLVGPMRPEQLREA